MKLSSTPHAELITKISYNANDDIEYIGSAAPDTNTSDDAWKLIKIEYDVSNNIVKLAFAEGNLNFNKVWDNRTSYTYS